MGEKYSPQTLDKNNNKENDYVYMISEEVWLKLDF